MSVTKMYVTDDDRDTIVWVREHGGIDHVRKEWRSRVPHERYEARRQRLLDHIAECETALRRRNQRIEELGKTIEFFQLNNSNFRHLLADVAERLGFTRYGDDYEPEDLLDSLDRRLMPEGYEWPRYESGELVNLGDDVSRHGEDFEANVIALYRDGSFSLNFWAYSKGERVKRHAVLAADGEPLKVGQTVWSVKDGTEYKVGGIRDTADVDGDLCKIIECSNDELHIYYVCIPPDKLTHQRPVLDADGVPIHEGDEVRAIWNYTGHSYVVEDASNPLEIAVRVKEYPDQRTTLRAKNLTHTKPEPPKRFCRDCAHWQKDPTADNMGVCWFLYHECEGQDCYSARLSDIGACEEFMPSARALAERERGE